MLSKMLIKGKLFFVGVSALLLAACESSAPKSLRERTGGAR